MCTAIDWFELVELAHDRVTRDEGGSGIVVPRRCRSHALGGAVEEGGGVAAEWLEKPEKVGCLCGTRNCWCGWWLRSRIGRASYFLGEQELDNRRHLCKTAS